MDPVFEEEQQHLSETYAKLCELEEAVSARLNANLSEAQEFKGSMSDELSLDLEHGSDDVNMETYASYEAMNSVIDNFNIAVDLDGETLARLRRLIRKPYFAKVSLKFPHRDGVRDIYLGSAGMADEEHRQFIVDWRSPVAETYYNQQTGPMSYEANGRTIDVDLQLRRQFDLDHDRLNAYFDTTIAIEDPLLLQSLASQRSSQLQAITATIQREQNLIVRHEDVPTLLVQGVAGSGKTSVMLQRIAYLLFHEREHLTADQVYLISPNPVFAYYIRNVLPELGEKNPHTLLWSDLMELLGPGNRSIGSDIDVALLDRIDIAVKDLELEPDDMCEIRVGERRLLTAQQVWKTVERYARRFPSGERLALAVEEDLSEKLRHRIDTLVGSEAVQDEVLTLDPDEQDRIFGHPLEITDEKELREYTRRYLDDVCETAFKQIEDAGWLRLDRIGMRLLGQESLSAAEWVYLKMAVIGAVDTTAKIVMVDEVQDYTAGQLKLLARYFSHAHFMLLGDANQAIKPGTATFDEIRAVFSDMRGPVDECYLMTSYRSSPEIIDLFAGVIAQDQTFTISSVQRPGIAPRIAAYPDRDTYINGLTAMAEDLRSQGGLSAVIANDRAHAKWLARVLESLEPVLIHDSSHLPDEGVVIIDLALAKGLEFDRSIVADANAETYPDNALARRRLYTALSRATKQVTVLAEGDLTPLLSFAVSGQDADKTSC